MLPQFDHLVIYVPNLEEAIKDFTDLGFEVRRGGSHGIAENALIIFSNHVYIELLALVPAWYTPLLLAANRFGVLHWLSGAKGNVRSRLLNWFRQDFGPVDWCVRVADIEGISNSWKKAGLSMLNTEKHSRKTIEGDVLQWYLGSASSADLPFLLEDISPIDERIPPLKSGAHDNGASALRHITFRVKNKASSEKIAATFLSHESLNTNINLGSLSVSFEEKPMPCRVLVKVSRMVNRTSQVGIIESHGVGIHFVSSAETISSTLTAS
tara:strand:- start:261 stop:1064 length:804 start_codon:yes stop_codon:yes gene_type:complete